MTTRHRVLLGLVCAASVSVASGCCTAALWSAAPDRSTSEGDGNGDDASEFSWRLLLTPPAVGIDVVTLPLQLLFVSSLRPAC